MERDTYSIVDPGSGEILTYPNTYANQEENYEAAQKVQNYIFELQAEVDSSFLKLGAALKLLKDEEYYLALGVPSFRAWMNSPDLHISYRLGVDLIRIVEELLPAFGDTPILPVSAMRELLPLIGTEHQDNLMEIVEDVRELPVRGVRDHIKELRGGDVNDRQVFFRARVERGEVYHRVWITRVGGTDADIYDVTPSPLRIKVEDWSRWQQRFSEGLIEYETG